jgi:hypothetical protein
MTGFDLVDRLVRPTQIQHLTILPAITVILFQFGVVRSLNFHLGS